MANVHLDLLAPAGMAEARTAAISAFYWFTHATTTEQFASIQKDGLNPTWTKSSTAPAEVIDTIGGDGKKIICLSTYPKPTPLMLNKGGKAVFKLALPADKLPVRVGIDWSFGGTWQLTIDNHSSINGACLGQVFLSVLRNLEVVVSYDNIPATDLKVCTVAVHDKPPADWLDLVGIDFKDVAIFKPDNLGYISL